MDCNFESINLVQTLIKVVMIFSGKVLNLFRLKFFFRCLSFDFFKFNSFLLLKERQTPLSNIEILKVTKTIVDF